MVLKWSRPAFLVTRLCIFVNNVSFSALGRYADPRRGLHHAIHVTTPTVQWQPRAEAVQQPLLSHVRGSVQRRRPASTVRIEVRTISECPPEQPKCKRRSSFFSKKVRTDYLSYYGVRRNETIVYVCATARLSSEDSGRLRQRLNTT